MEAGSKLTVVIWCQIFYSKSTASSGGHFCRWRFTRDTLTSAVSALPAIGLKKTLMRIHGGLQIWLRSYYKVFKKRGVILLNKKHSVCLWIPKEPDK